MSYQIEYRHRALRVDLVLALAAMAALDRSLVVTPAMKFDHRGDGFLVFSDRGSSKPTDQSTAQPSRQWDLASCGTTPIVDAIDWAHETERGRVRLHGREVFAEDYIAHYRRLAEQASPVQALSGRGVLTFELKFHLFDLDRAVGRLAARMPLSNVLSRSPAVLARTQNKAWPMQLNVPLGDQQLQLATLGWLVTLPRDVRRHGPLIRLAPGQDHLIETWLFSDGLSAAA